VVLGGWLFLMSEVPLYKRFVPRLCQTFKTVHSVCNECILCWNPIERLGYIETLSLQEPQFPAGKTALPRSGEGSKAQGAPVGRERLSELRSTLHGISRGRAQY